MWGIQQKSDTTNVLKIFPVEGEGLIATVVGAPAAGWANIDRQTGSRHSDQQFWSETFPFFMPAHMPNFFLAGRIWTDPFQDC